MQGKKANETFLGVKAVRRMMKNKCGNRKECLVFLVFCLGTLVLRIFYISKINGPFVYPDEFG